MNKVSIKSDLVEKWSNPHIYNFSWRNNSVELIYFDEFSLSSRHVNLYGWSKIGRKGYVIQDNESFKIGFIIAFSMKMIYGIMGDSWHSWNGNYYIDFLKSVLKTRWLQTSNKTNDFVMIWDNAAYHKSKEMKKFLDEYNIKVFNNMTLWTFVKPHWENNSAYQVKS